MGEAKRRAERGEKPEPSRSSADRAAAVLVKRRSKQPIVTEDVMTRQRRRRSDRLKASRPQPAAVPATAVQRAGMTRLRRNKKRVAERREKAFFNAAA